MVHEAKSTIFRGDFLNKIEYTRSWFGVRHTQCILLFFLHIIAFGSRTNMSVAIVAMTDPLANPNKEIPTYQWGNNNIILSSFFWGYIITPIAAGQLSKKVGPKKILITGICINSVACGVIPFMASFGSWGVIFCRVIQGLSLGVYYPMCHFLLGKWAPIEERSRLGSFVYTGAALGTVVSLLVTGLISSSTVGWPYVFYLYGGLGLIWCFIFFMLGSNSPAEHRTIDVEERKYIESSLNQSGDQQVSKTPWKAILTSMHVWALVVAHCGQNWGGWTLLTNIPTFLKAVLKYDLAENGLLSAGPYLTLWILSNIFSWTADCVIKNKIATVGVTRKVSNSIGLYVPAAALFALGQICSSDGDITNIILVLLFVAVGANAGTYCGYLVNHIDLSPIYAGNLISLTNTIASMFSLVGPLALHWIVTDEENTSQWATAFYIASGFYICGNTFFIIFGSGEVQTWNSPNALI